MPDPTGWSAPFLTTAPAGEEIIPDPPTPKFAKYYRTSNQAISYNTETEIAFNGKTSDSDTDFPAASGQIALPYTGLYIVTGQVNWNADGSESAITNWQGQKYAHLEKQISGTFRTIVDAHNWSLQTTAGPDRNPPDYHIHMPFVPAATGYKEVDQYTDIIRAVAGERVRVMAWHNTNSLDTCNVLGENLADNRGPRLTFLSILYMGG